MEIVMAVLTKKKKIQAIAKEKNIAPTLISLWKKQAEDAILERFKPQPKGRRKQEPAPDEVAGEVKELKNAARKSRIKAAHLESSVRDLKATVGKMESFLQDLAEHFGYTLVRTPRPRKSRNS